MRTFVSLTAALLCLTSGLFAETSYLPQIGDGEASGVQLRTSFLFVNAGAGATINLALRSDIGEPMTLDLGGSVGSGSDFELTLAAGASLVLETSGASDQLKVGYARVDAPSSVGSTAVFTGIDAASGIPLYEAGVPATAPAEQFTILVDSLSNRDTGLAIVRPEAPSAQATSSDSITLRLVGLDGQVLGTALLDLAPGEKRVGFVRELLTGDLASEAQEMQGSLQIEATGAAVAAVTLRQLQNVTFPAGVPVLTTFPVVQGASGTTLPGWQLVWHDEFDGDAVDASKWSFQIGTGPPEGPVDWGNAELEYYREENAVVHDGALHIIAKRENFGGKAYTSARLRTKGKGDWTYGRIEFRAKIPAGQGLWPALWMMPTDNVYGGWPASGEIDIMEAKGHVTNQVSAALHFTNQSGQHAYTGGSYVFPSGNYFDDFHTYALMWAPGEIRWYVDGTHYLTKTQWYTTGGEFPAPFDQNFHILMNLAVGGNYLGNDRDPSQTAFPKELVIDYVRVYQRPED